MPLLFVYGTLRRPVGGPPGDTHYHHRISDEIISARTATLLNAELFDLGPYPGIGVGDGTVRGEVFDISEDALVEADQVEGHPDFYERRFEPVAFDDGTTSEAWAYWAPPALLASATLVPSGDWFDRVRRDDFSSIDEHLDEAKSAKADTGSGTANTDVSVADESQ